MEYTYGLTSTTSTSTTWPMNFSGGTTYVAPLAVYSGGTSTPAPRPQTALEWLDAEIEATCKLARQGA